MTSDLRLPLRRALGLAAAFALVGTLAADANTIRVPNGGVPEGATACSAANPNGSRYSQSCGAQVSVTAGDLTPAYVQDNSPSSEPAYRVRFYANLRNLQMQSAEEFDLFAAYNGSPDPVPPANAGNAVLRLVVRQSGSQKVLVAVARTDSGSEISSPTFTLPTGWREIEVDWARATSAGANNGRLSLWIDGVSQATSLTSLDNDTLGINYARWGAVAGIDAGTSGTFRLDDFASQRSGYLGPVSVFTDVPVDVYWPYIHRLYNAEITTGCALGQYCPGNPVSRAEMAVFLIRGTRGPGFAPASPTGVFADVPVSFWAAPQIEQLRTDGITTGCAANPLRFCPTDNVTRAEMAVFLLRARHGGSYTPPPPSGTLFADVPANHWAVSWIEQLYNEGITTGCANSPLRFCPESQVTRLEMAIFLSRTFNLPPLQTGP